MALVCEDLSFYGVVLIPPDSQQYFDFLADIERRLQNRSSGSPPVRSGALSRISEHDTTGSAILVNRATVAIAAVAYFWSLRLPKGRIVTSSRSPGTNASVLLPFLQLDRIKKVDAYLEHYFSRFQAPDHARRWHVRRQYRHKGPLPTNSQRAAASPSAAAATVANHSSSRSTVSFS